MEKDALAQQEKIILEAQAEAESIRLKGESRAYAIEVRAKVIRLVSSLFNSVIGMTESHMLKACEAIIIYES